MMEGSETTVASEVSPAELTYREAVREAMADAMRRDASVVLMGEDVALPGGVFKTSVGLHDEFGPNRVIDMPIAENGFVGAALGLAVTGMRPIVEIMFSDFLGVCFDQIANSVAKARYMSGAQTKVPLVIRTIGGGGSRFGGQHSQTGESWFRVFPGLKIVAASNPAEAYGMLTAAIEDDNPVLFIEHKGLYGKKGQVVRGAAASLDAARVVRQGKDATVVASLLVLNRALEAAEILAERGMDIEVIDIRSLRPVDTATISESVRKTNRLMTVEEQPVCGGWGGDVIASVVYEAFEYLDAPPVRIGLPDAPLPSSPVLEDAAMPSTERLVVEIESLVRS